MMLRLTIIFVLLAIFCLRGRAQDTAAFDAEKIYRLLPDSCFARLADCLGDSLFAGKNRYRLLDSTIGELRPEIQIDAYGDEEPVFSITADACNYTTTVSFTWWYLTAETVLVAVLVDEVDMCTERQSRYFYELAEAAIRRVEPLPAVTIDAFVSLRALKKHKIPRRTPAPVFISRQAKSDTLIVELALGPYLNCTESYEDSPFIRLDEKNVVRSVVAYCRVRALFVRCRLRK
jgi:hypothetical protein